MELLTPYLAQLGLAGVVFVLLLGLAQLGLTQFVKVVLQKWGAPVQGGAVLALSLLLGALLGMVMLSRVATLLDIGLPSPWGGLIAGLVLAAIVSGMVSYRQQRSAEQQGHQTAALGVLLSQVAAAAPQVVAVPVPTIPVAVPSPDPGPPLVPPPVAVPDQEQDDATLLEDLRPITPEETANMTRTDWPATELGIPTSGPPR